MQIAEHDVPLGITTSIKKVLEDHHVKVQFTNIMKESPFGDDAPDDVFCTELLILYDSKQPPVKVDVYHNNTNEGFAQSFNLQIWLPWRRGLSDEKKIKALCSRFDIKTPKLANKAFNKVIFNIDSGFFNRLTQLSFVKQLCMIVRFNNLKSQVILLGIKVLNFDQLAAEHFGDIFADLEKKHMRIGDRDMLIAGHARSLGYTLVTNNVREFSRVEGLLYEDWK